MRGREDNKCSFGFVYYWAPKKKTLVLDFFFFFSFFLFFFGILSILTYMREKDLKETDNDVHLKRLLD